ncbi:hypothetical protein [Elizabethkingia miricola]|uniref:hypothetical protein n=1 Tax=Elizabethkingia miricola TaxID=172045 RepID=UPI002469993D|nr:hypothetical protein [Elizabethkingia miricola]WGL74427.1 hypothetical protein QFB80_05105 [Elizabethkingia miricola]
MSFSKEYDCYSKVLNVRAATSGNVPIIDHRAAGTTICKEYDCYSKVPDMIAATSGNVPIIALQLITELQECRLAKSTAVIDRFRT